MDNRNTNSRVIFIQYFAGILFLLGWFGTVQATTNTLTTTPTGILAQQRKIYQTFNEVLASKDFTAAQQLLPQLKSYLLYPYAKYHYLVASISSVTVSQAKIFITEYANYPFATKFADLFVKELAKRKAWSSILQFLPYPPTDTAASCRYYYAQWLAGNKYQALNEARLLWLTGSNDPTACKPLFAAWQKNYPLNNKLIKQRIILAITNNNYKLAEKLTNDLSANENKLKNSLQLLLQTPNTLQNFIINIPVSDFAKQVVMLMFNPLAKKNVVAAQKALALAVKKYGYTSTQQLTIQEEIAAQLFSVTTTTQQAKWRDSIIRKSRDASLIEQRLRLAIATNNEKDLAYWLSYLPPTLRQDSTWQYWYADTLIATKEPKKMAEGQEILTKLSQSSGYYAMLSAQRIGKSFILNIPKISPNSKQWQNQFTIQQISELMYWHDVLQANRLWLPFVEQHDSQQQASLASYALDQGWDYLSMTATIKGKLWDNIKQRFPLAFYSLFHSALTGKSITEDYALAIGRQESLFNPLAISSAGAMGVMQLMPNTATHIAKSQNEITYTFKKQLLNPKINIYLGTLYLNYIYKRFHNNRILASAAYNAGPINLDKWLQRSNGKLSAAQFIEAIPFKETRNYVKNTLAFAFYYRKILGENPKTLLTTSEYNKMY